METLLAALAVLLLLTTVLFIIPLIMFAAGIRRQEHAGLDASPRSISATLTSRIVGLRTATTPPPPARLATRVPSRH
jgi:hypothetical protein